MSREKQHDEVYCRSCGEPIKKRAEICPECGVRNQYAGGGGPETTAQSGTHRGQAAGGPPAQQQPGTSDNTTAPEKPHDPTCHTTTVNGHWHYGVAVATALWILGFTLPSEGATGSLVGFLVLVAWGLMPVSIYYDRQWLRATTEWDPDLNLWLIGSVLPVLNVGVGPLYLFRRSNVPQVSPPSAGIDERVDGSDDALATLRERYSRGEIDDVEFERRLENIVGTEDETTAKVHARDSADEE